MKKYLTTPIYYANGKPHIGHACTTILCDVLKRSLILQGHDVFLSTGLDEHAQKVQTCIETSGKTTEVYLNEIKEGFKDLFSKLNINYDDFINTTEERHKKVVKYVLLKLYNEGAFIKKKHEGQYCLGCEQFKLERELIDGCCPDHKKPTILYSEENWFLNLDTHKHWLKSLLETPGFLTESYVKEMLNMIEGEVPDLCISRPKSRQWLGVELPFDLDENGNSKFVTYVWFDALLNYITVLGYPNWDEVAECYWKECTHMVGKDIVKTHSIFWPIMLKVMGINPPKRELVHGYYTTGGDKMGKSLGNGLDVYKAIEIFGADSVRYAISKLTTKIDVEFDFSVMLSIFNSDLANTIGNAFFRTYTLSRKTFENEKVPAANFNETELNFLNEVKNNLTDILPKAENIEDVNIFVKKVLDAFRSINFFLDKTAPWNEQNSERKSQLLLCTLEAIRMCFEVLSVILVENSEKVLKTLGINFNPKEKLKLEISKIPAEHKLEETTPLFLRMKQDELESKLK